MLLYVIPFVLLLVVAIVLKKREDANKENDRANAKKSNKKTAKKNVARTARSSQRQHTQVVEDSVVVKQETKPLNADLKKTIEKLISEKNYFSAEAKINQALNQDNSQHELYLYLIDVHLVQKDEFAINQLINHIRMLGLDDIVAQAEERQKAAQAENPIESIAFESTTPVVAETKDTTAFDALIGSTETPVETVSTFEHKVITESLTPSSVSVNELEKEHSPQQIQPLEFTLSPSTPETKSELNFSSDQSHSIEENKTETVAPLEFSFTPNKTKTLVEKPVEIAPEFKLDFAESAPSLDASKNISEVEFKLSPSEAEVQPAFQFELDATPETVEQKNDSVTSLEFSAAEQPTTSVLVDTNDPLIASFPELAEVNEIQLNLDLAQQYIELGAYTSARTLLTQNEASYTPEQRQQSQNLLNQIAS